MESSRLEVIQQQLQQERSEVHAKADQLRDQLHRLDDELARMDAALAALAGTPLASGKAAKAKERKKVETPSPKKADVVAVIRDTLHKKGVIEPDALKAVVEQQLVAAGFSRLGLAMRFQEALADSRFVDTPAGIRLKEEEKEAKKVPVKV